MARRKTKDRPAVHTSVLVDKWMGTVVCQLLHHVCVNSYTPFICTTNHPLGHPSLRPALLPCFRFTHHFWSQLMLSTSTVEQVSKSTVTLSYLRQWPSVDDSRCGRACP